MSVVLQILPVIYGTMGVICVGICCVGAYLFYKNRHHPAIIYRCSSINLFGLMMLSIQQILQAVKDYYIYFTIYLRPVQYVIIAMSKMTNQVDCYFS